MKKLLMGLIAAVMMGTNVMAQEAEEESKKPCWLPDVDLTLEYASRYLSDGRVINPKQMIFIDAFANWTITDDFGFYGDLWFANDWNDYNKDSGIKNEPEEIDWSIGVWYHVGGISGIGGLNFDLSHSRWFYPERTGWNCPGETKYVLALDISTDDIKITDKFSWKPGICTRLDYENDEWNTDIYAKTSWEIVDKLTLDNKAQIFWGNSKWNAGSNGRYVSIEDEDGEVLGYAKNPIYKNMFTTFVLSADLTYQLTDHFSVAAFGKLAYALNHTFRDSWKGEGNPNHASGCNDLWGVRLGVSF